MRFLYTLVIFSFSFSGFSQNVGIGTTMPLALLHVKLDTPNINNGFLITGLQNAYSTVPDLGDGPRLMFYPGKGAFRAGNSIGSGWDNINVGRFSTAFGYATRAIGTSSFASGDGSVSYTNGSVAVGLSSKAKGYASTVIGMYNDTLLTGNEGSATSTTPLFIIGNGNSGIQRSNAMVVRKSGDVQISGNLSIQNGKGLIRSGDGT